MGCFTPDCPEDASHEVAEVWFDFGEPNMRFCSSTTLYPETAPTPRFCEKHFRDDANSLASKVLIDAKDCGAAGPLWPTRWWVRFADGLVVGGDVMPQPAGPAS